jgi:hypothetical protein
MSRGGSMTAKQRTKPPVPTEAPVTDSEALAHFRMLTGKVDAFFNRVEGQHKADMACHTGCNDCCHVRLSVTSVEAQIIEQHWPTLSPEARQVLRERSHEESDGLCSALGDDGRCSIYEARPLVCRSHGLPLRLRQEGRLPIIDACFRNFNDKGPGAVAPDNILDQQTLSTALLAIDAAFARSRGRPAGQRVDLGALFARLSDEPTPGPA